MEVEDPWNTIVYSSSIPVPTSIKQLLVKQVLKSEGTSESNPTHIHNSRGRAALLERGGRYKGLVWSVDMEIGESIVVWHMATDMYLYWYKEQAKDHPEYLQAHAEVIKAVEALSNYMLFLLAVHP
ncbi:uncharacterized protein C2845_PM15G00930 [Panicum miliaceum]|uniref:Uncharacterized protein n=1 Tax=Panicum miliaceum TaxID=4540 RepID=A0A3L6Q812_PANMI|nr:uncharacterized protein C2845_PM15G00930 [Panicum miliaceum]